MNTSSSTTGGTAEDGKSGEDHLFIACQTTQGRRNRHQDTERQTSPFPRASNDEQTPPERRIVVHSAGWFAPLRTRVQVRSGRTRAWCVGCVGRTGCMA